LTLVAIGLVLLQCVFVKYRSSRRSDKNEAFLRLPLLNNEEESWDWDIIEQRIALNSAWDLFDFPEDGIRKAIENESNIHSEDQSNVSKSLKAYLNGETEDYALSYRIKNIHDQWIWVLDKGKVVEYRSGQASKMAGTLTNIHETKQAEVRLKLFQHAMQEMTHGMFIADPYFNLVEVNSAYCEFIGQTKQQALTQSISFDLYPKVFTDEILSTLKNQGHWSGEINARKTTGEENELSIAIDALRSQSGEINHFVGILSEITDKKRSERELLELSIIDPLTDLPNFAFFQIHHTYLISKNSAHSLIYIQVNDLNKINTSLSYQAGEKLIFQMAKRLKSITNQVTHCYGMDAEVYLMTFEQDLDLYIIKQLANQILDTLAMPFRLNQHEYVPNISIGIASFPEDGTEANTIFKKAQASAAQAKNLASNRFQFFEPDTQEHTERLSQIENLIHQGIQDDYFLPYYHPRIDISSGVIVGMEALIRFEHPSKGVVSPKQFMPVAQQTGQIVDISEILMKKVIEDTRQWVNSGLFHGRVAINIAEQQLALLDLDTRIEKMLHNIGLSPLHLEFEFNENTILADPKHSLALMEKLRQRGIHLALDNFGEAESSFKSLRLFPFTTLKLDKTLIDLIERDNADRTLVSSLIKVAHGLSMKVIAEGVETVEQLNTLRQIECDQLQGYLVSKPVSAKRFERLLFEKQMISA
jgi:PAS domain S-box-containing protein/diguanylate cyclase (GGDEF)-like protein